MATRISPSSVFLCLVLEEAKKDHFWIVISSHSTFYYFFLFQEYLLGLAHSALGTWAPWLILLFPAGTFREMNSISLDFWGIRNRTIWINCGCEVFQVLHVFHEQWILVVDSGMKVHLHCWRRNSVWLCKPAESWSCLKFVAGFLQSSMAPGSHLGPGKQFSSTDASGYLRWFTVCSSFWTCSANSICVVS